MKRFTQLIAAFVCLATIGTVPIKAQNCNAYFPMKPGVSFETTHYNEKDKLETVVTTTVLDKSREEGSVTMTASCKVTDAKGKESNTFAYDVTCAGDEFKMDMRSMGSQTPQMEGVEMKIESEDMVFPKNMTVGTTLPDAHMQMTGTMSGMTIMNTSIKIYNRKVTASENLTTPAGTFACVVVEEDGETKMMGMTIASHTKSWYSLGVGLIRSEYASKGKPTGYSILTKISGN